MKIFVQVASYRDPELKPTIISALKKANHPKEVSFGICLQVRPKEIVPHLPLSKLPHCRVVVIEALKSKGIGYARSKAQAMWDGEPYTLQIDSHMRFEKGWDARLIKSLENAPSNKPIITAYLSDYENEEETMNFCLGAQKFNPNGLLSLWGTRVAMKRQRGMFISGHFLFTRSNFFEEVPPDPDMQFLYEESSLGPRAWTHGWDIFHPFQPIMRHRWDRKNRGLNWADKDVTKEGQKSNKLYRQLLGMVPGFSNYGVYGLGKERALKDFERVSGVSFRNQVITEDARNATFRW